MERRSPKFSLARIVKLSWVMVCALAIVACHLDMYDQPRAQAYNKVDLLPNNAEAQPPVANTVARNADLDPVLTTGKQGDQFVQKNPLTVDEKLLARGKERYNIVCITCHGAQANGKGVVAGYFNPPPASMYLERLRNAPDGYIFQVITYGKGQMFSQAQSLSPEDRWAIIAYIRSLEQNPPQGVVANPTEVPNPTPRPAGTAQPNQPELP